ncbi:protein kinase domain-containing protein [Kitasatospora viridis]|uniref:Serine/threonine protein kinase n=1 Tax=Kitasatospora viridis TaxID=281105 RepID=A0A561T6R2_9ACTN|nr:protein kinase [Kitasatospora viridis]TWF82806.1 serine/threonine protein kinase [Kitasatospora viridis]
MQELGEADPRRVGRFEILAVLGTGGMGTVYLGRPTPSGDEEDSGPGLVAVKVVHPDLARTEDFRARFRREVAATRAVAGPHLAGVLDFGEDDELPWLATEYVPGPSLRAVLVQHGALPVDRVRALGAGLAEALTAIHAANLVHRDVKPANILMAETGPTLIDFGIARSADDEDVTRTGVLMGTAQYISPEQLRGRGAPVGPAADVFALSCVLAYAASGRHPFGVGVAEELLYRIVHEEPDLAGIDARLVPVLRRGLAKQPEERPTAAELHELLTAELPAAEPLAIEPPAAGTPLPPVPPLPPTAADPDGTPTTLLPPLPVGPPMAPPTAPPQPAHLPYLEDEEPPELPPVGPAAWQSSVRWLVLVGAVAVGVVLALIVALPGSSPSAPSRPADPVPPVSSASVPVGASVTPDSPSASAAPSTSAPASSAPPSSAPPSASASPSPAPTSSAPTPSPSATSTPSPTATGTPSPTGSASGSPSPSGSASGPVPQPVTGITTSLQAADTKVVVSWAAQSDATGYDLSYKVNKVPGTHQQSTTGTTVSFDSVPGDTVCIQLRAVNQYGSSAWSAPKCIRG